jgi:hypothetical protein
MSWSWNSNGLILPIFIATDLVTAASHEYRKQRLQNNCHRICQLIAEDDQTTCLILENFILAQGIMSDVVHDHDGAAAVQAATNRISFLEFVDFIMPLENGDEASLRPTLRVRFIGNKKKYPM